MNPLLSWLLIAALATALWAVVAPFMSTVGRRDDEAEVDRLIKLGNALSQSEKAPATDRCGWCDSPILRENTPSGVCDECVARVLDQAYEHDVSVAVGGRKPPLHLIVDDGHDVLVFHAPEQTEGDVVFGESFSLLPLNGNRLDVFREEDTGAVVFLSDEPWPCSYPGCPSNVAAHYLPWGWRT